MIHKKKRGARGGEEKKHPKKTGALVRGGEKDHCTNLGFFLTRGVAAWRSPGNNRAKRGNVEEKKEP